MTGLTGVAMLLCVAAAMVWTGQPTWLLLVGVASIFAMGGVIGGGLPPQLLTSIPSRVIGLLENDLLQALPLYVLMGALLNRLPLADALFRAATIPLRRSAAGPAVAALGLGGVLAPMNGSVGASILMLARTVAPRLLALHVPQARTTAIVAMASTLGVVVPPSLVLILLGDAMLRAHTEAVNITGKAAQIINTQDVFRGALLPAAAIFLLALAITWWTCRRSVDEQEQPAVATLPVSELVTALIVLTGIIALLGAVTLGYLYAVEAAATGGVALFAYGIVTGTLTRTVLREVLHNTLTVTGALFALLVGATVFTLVLRSFGTDRLVAAWLMGMGGGEYAPLAAALLVLALCAFVLDAFEMIFVVIPVLMPPVLVRVPDPVWVAVLTLLILQASFLVPPFGYAVQMVRNTLNLRVPVLPLSRALWPYLAAQLIVIALVLAMPGALWRATATDASASIPRTLSDDEAREQMMRQLGPPPE